MAAGKEIRGKIKSVENTKKITKAMEMVAASKMRKAQERMRAARPYAEKIRSLAANLSKATPEYKHPFQVKNEGANMPTTCHWMTGVTLLIVWMSEILVGTVEHASAALGLSKLFVGIVVVAVVGNAAEHSTAVLVAMRNRMEMAVGIAIGSCIQIALFVAPVLVRKSSPACSMPP